jgi:hypothetical protein
MFRAVREKSKPGRYVELMPGRIPRSPAIKYIARRVDSSGYSGHNEKRKIELIYT